MTEATITTIVTVIAAAIPPTLVALAALRQGQRNEIKQNENTLITEETNKKAESIAVTSAAVVSKADTIIDKATEIHTLANSRLSELTKSYEVAIERISGLEKLLQQKDETKKDIVVVNHQNGITPKDPQPLVDARGEVVESLKQIDQNTAAIEQNTAKTTADVARNTVDVQELKDKAP